MTVNEIARLAGVSRGTVDRVIHNRGSVSPEIQERILRIIQETGFTLNPVASALKRSGRPLALGILQPSTENAFYLEIQRGFDAAEQHFSPLGVELHRQIVPDITSEALCTAVDSLMDTGIDGLILTAVTSPELENKIQDLSLPVVTYNSDFLHTRRLCFVGQDHISAGRTAGDLVCRSLRRPGQLLPLISYPNMLAHVQRVRGLESVLDRCPLELEVLPPLQTRESDQVAYDQTLRALRELPELCCIYSAGGGQVGVADALKDSGRSSEVLLICYDLLPRTVEHLKAGVVDFTIGQQPFLQGYLPVSLLYDELVLRKHPDREYFYTSIDVRLGENADFNGLSAMSPAF